MPASATSAFPPAALGWLVPDPDDAVLVLGRSAGPLTAALSAQGTRLVASDATAEGVRSLLHRAPRAVPTVCDPEHLPFAPLSFGTVLLQQSLHRTTDATLAEIARVLAPNGHLGVSYTVRDDSVPWVRRLVALLRQVDPDAMAGDYGTDSLDRVVRCPHFVDVEERRHRLWVPIARVDLLDMVARRFPDLEQSRLSRLMGAVGDLYESSARAPEPLLLPYQVVCWRARVDHAQFTSALQLPDDALSIRL